MSVITTNERNNSKTHASDQEPGAHGRSQWYAAIDACVEITIDHMCESADCDCASVIRDRIENLREPRCE